MTSCKQVVLGVKAGEVVPPNFSTVERGWALDPKLEWADLAYQIAQHHPYKLWNTLALLGCFAAYRDGCHLPLADLGTLVPRMYADVHRVVAMRGIDTACRAVAALFSEEFAWVTDKTVSFLLSEKGWAQIESYLQREAVKHTAGEQSEFGDRGTTLSCKRVKL